MGERNGLTLVEVVVVIFILLLIAAIFMPALGKMSPIAHRVVCGINLKGLGTAIAVYANDYDGAYPELPGKGAWSKELGFDYSMTRPDFGPGGAQELAGRTISASWYLLVREADVWPKDEEPSEQDRQGGTNPTARDEATDARSEEDSFLGI